MSTLRDLRTSLTPTQRAIVNVLFKFAQEHEGKHMPVIGLYDTFGGQKAVAEALSDLDDRVILKHPNNVGLQRYGLSFLGYLLCDRGEEIQDILVRYLEFVRSKLKDDFELSRINFIDLKERANFSNEEFELFLSIFFNTPLHNGGGISGSGIPPNVNQWIIAKDLNRYLEETALETRSIIDVSPRTLINYVQSTETVNENPNPAPPEHIVTSLRNFRKDHPDSAEVGFVMMRFDKSVLHQKIFRTIVETLKAAGLTAVRADDKEYHDHLLFNVETYMYGCGFGIAVFEHAEGESFNPNVALEVGYMQALQKPVCFLKDQTLPALQSDLAGKLYRDFDPQDVETTIARELSSWLRSRGYIT